MPAPPETRFLFPWRQIKDFAGFHGDGTYLWPRWIVLRAIGLVFVVIFAGIIDERPALIGPDGLVPLPSLMAQLRAVETSAIEAFLRAPTLFWLSSSPGMAAAVEWCGMLAAVALVLNLWPRMALFACWLCLLSFARGWLVFSDPQVDWLMLEVALLSIPFAPAGFRPGLGARSPPRPLAVFMVRWLLFRVMFESGLAKLLSGEPHWTNLTAMNVLYEIAPCPTILGYLDFQLPHAWHAGEAVLTFAAEIGAPLLAVFGGRRGRWWAFWLWSVLQVGIQLTCNFGWLNTASLALGLLLLDDQMLAAAARFSRLRRLAQFLATSAAGQAMPPPARAWLRHGLSAALWTHFYLSLIAFGDAAAMPPNAVRDAISRPLNYLFHGFGSVNAYQLYARLDPLHLVVEFVGSNDGGQTWRPYEFRYFPQQLDRIPPFLAPRFPRFEATLQIAVATRDDPATLYRVVATRLLEQKPEVLRLFASNPFPDRPPQMIRMPGYKYNFTDFATFRASGHFWKRSYIGEYLPMVYLSPTGEIAQAVTEFDQVAIKARYGNPVAQRHLGFLYISGEEGVERDGAEAAKWLRLAAEQGLVEAQFNLALILVNGDGVPQNSAEAAGWFRLAAEQGFAPAQHRLGVMYFRGEGLPRDEIEALAWFELAALAGQAEAQQHRAYVRARVAPAQRVAAGERARAIAEAIAERKRDSIPAPNR